jgi:hypothetical protein
MYVKKLVRGAVNDAHGTFSPTGAQLDSELPKFALMVYLPNLW